MQEITPQSIRQAHSTISPFLTDTPLIYSRTLSELCDCDMLLKLESLQMTGSFKERGALNKLLSLSEQERARGVIAASAGNHAHALAYHAHRLGIATTIVMPQYSPLVKIQSTEYWGAEVVLHGETFDDAFQHSQQLLKQHNRVYVHPFDDPLVVEGQGTMAVDLLEHNLGQDIDMVLVPVGGGGLISGLATYLKSECPDITIVGVEETNCDAMHQALQSGAPVRVPARTVIADGIAVRQVSQDNLTTVANLVDDMITVTNDETANALMLMLEIEKLVIEASAAVPLAALLNRKLPEVRGKKVVSIISGGNIDVNLLARVINRGLAFDGRTMALKSVIMDRPGALEKLLGLFHQSGANVLEIDHHRLSGSAPVGEIDVSITLETRNRQHGAEIRELMVKQGYRLRE